MDNISKIKISGTSYSIKDENACKVVELTQAQYDDLPASAKTSNSLFVITDAKAGDLSNYYTKTETDNAITAATSTKQDTLVSGTNIKTINSQSILGEGNITIEGGGGGITSSEVQTMIDESISGKTNQNDNLFTIRTNVIEAVVLAGGKNIRIIFAFDIIQNNQIVLSTDTVNDKTSLLSALATLGFDNNIYDIRNINYSNDTKNTSYFGEFLGHKCYAVLLNYVPDFGSITIGLKRNDVFYTLDSVSNGNYNYNLLSDKPEITTTITSSSTDAQVPSAKAVYDMVGNINTILESI